jgi:hypothetical protein
MLYPPYGIIEGRVAEPSTDPTSRAEGYKRGSQASVAIDDSSPGGNSFLVAWRSDFLNETGPSGQTVSAVEVLAAVFDSSGACLVGPRRLSTPTFLAPPSQIERTQNALPSVAISQGSVRVGWVSGDLGFALESEFGPSSAQLKLADFLLSDPPANWPLLCRTAYPNDYTPSVGASALPSLLRTVGYSTHGSSNTDPRMLVGRTPNGSTTTILDSGDCGTGTT